MQPTEADCGPSGFHDLFTVLLSKTVSARWVLEWGWGWMFLTTAQFGGRFLPVFF